MAIKQTWLERDTCQYQRCLKNVDYTHGDIGFCEKHEKKCVNKGAK